MDMTKIVDSVAWVEVYSKRCRVGFFSNAATFCLSRTLSVNHSVSVGAMETIVRLVTDPRIAEMASSLSNSGSLQKKTVWVSRLHTDCGITVSTELLTI